MQPGDKFFVLVNLKEWDGGCPIRRKTVKEFQSASHHSDRVFAEDGMYYHQWYLSLEEAEKAVVDYVKKERSRLDDLLGWLTLSL